VFLIFIDEIDVHKDEVDEYIKFEKHEIFQQVINCIKRKITDVETVFFNKLKEIIEKGVDRNLIAETSKELNLEILKGWDIFRRIQRKSRECIKPQKIDINIIEDRTKYLMNMEIKPHKESKSDVWLYCEKVINTEEKYTLTKNFLSNIPEQLKEQILKMYRD